MKGPCLLLFAALCLMILLPAHAQTTHLWCDTSSNNQCSRSLAGSGVWTLQNVYNNKSVTVVLNRYYTNNGSTSTDTVTQNLGPSQVAYLGCSTWPTGHQAYSVKSITLH
jgi:hypothetical protein